MKTAIVTGSGGLVGGQCVSHFVEAGFHVIGMENNMRGRFFGAAASTEQETRRLTERYDEFRSVEMDVRDREAVERVFRESSRELELVVHTAAQPSHDWAAHDPHTDFGINAAATVNLLQAARDHAPDATFIFCSTNKVYGDRPNGLPLEDHPTRLELPEDHPWFRGIDTTMSIDRSLHSLFGVSP